MIINQGFQSRTVKLVTSNKKIVRLHDPPPLPWEVTPLYGYSYMHIGMCSPNEYGFFSCFGHK